MSSEEQTPNGRLNHAGGDRVSTTMRATASVLYDAVKVRERLFGIELFTDPAWHMLLDLVMWHDLRRLSVSAVCLGARVPHATAMRYLTDLLERDLVVRIPDPTDRRRSFISLSARGVSLMAIALKPFQALCSDDTNRDALSSHQAAQLNV